MLIMEYRAFCLGPRLAIHPMGQSGFWTRADGIILRTCHEGHVFPYPISKVEDLFSSVSFSGNDGRCWFRVNHGFITPEAVPAILHARRLPKHHRYTFCVEMTFDDLMTLHLSL